MSTTPETPTERNDAETADEMEDRTKRALSQCMTVLPDHGRADGVDHWATVTTGSGSTYLVDMQTGGCECADKKYNLGPETDCKHLRRAKIATGRRSVSSDELANVDVDPLLGEHSDGPVIMTSDGGVITPE
ncbi:zinc finger SWIM domain-containing protein [Halorhabdus tiamatea SARL4B]|uniref:Zinc finger SWIM domain-containing protein n=1 Tax=Halorhabdus tiamatea SARL4B TaxID=1033806 RepID=U2DY37_9EURY|nr:hypothetical protein [Halorhabdus tiamatea]ERJ05088.1 zinc finger SWIM domain-containing protein [Halorhabdus tiamatea SARL4B]